MAPTTTVRVDDLPADVLAKERELADALEAFLERQEKVVLARLYGPKARKGTRHWKAASAKAFDPREPRDVRGRWTVVSFPVETLKGVWAGDYDTTRVGDLPDVLPARPDLADVAKRGVREPIHLTRLPEPDEGAEYELQDGHNRAAAAIRARLTHIPAVIHEPVLDAQGGITYPTWDAAMVQGVRRRAKAAAPAALSSTQPAPTPAWALDTPPPAPASPSLTQVATGAAAVTGAITVPPITAGVGVLQAAFILDATRWALLLRAVLDPFIEYSVAAAHEDLARQLAEESLFGSLALAFKRGLIEPWIQRGTDTMQRHFRDVQLTIDRGERQGRSLEQIATSIRAAYKKKRDWARLVAGNVMVGAFNAGQQAAAQVNPRVVQKAWVTQRDEKVRPTHRAAEGQVQDVDAPFIVGGGPMMYPGDLTAPIGEWINCRCTMVFRIQSKPSAVPFRVNDRRQRDLVAMRNERDSKGWHSTGVKVGHDVSRELRGAHGRWVRTSGGLLDRPAAQRMWRDTLSEVGASGSDPWQVQDVSWGSIPGAPQTPMARLKATVAHDLAARMADVDASELASAAAAGDRPGSTMRADSISALVQVWAGTSNDSSVLSLSLQEAAKTEFGLADAARWDVGDELSPTNKMVHRNLKEHGDVYRKFLRAQYDATQADFKAQGITSVQVYRGMTAPADRHGNPLSIPGVIPKGVGKTPTPMTITTRPMSSWSTDPYIAYGQFGEGGVTFGATVPIERVLSTPRTGFGALRESEIVLLGGPLDTVAIQSDALVGTGSSSPFTAALPTQVKASAGQPYNVDDGDEYADWLRALGWDLPEDLDGFLTAIGGRGNVEHFMTLPAARAMPVALRVLLDAPQDKAFNPALHPRDERGRWARVAHALTQALRTAPMGGTVAPREATVAAVSDVIATGHVAMTKARGLAQLRKVQPNIDPEFAHELVDSHKIYDVRGATVLVEKGTSPTVTKPFLDQVDSLQAKNPLKDPGMLVFLSREAFQALEADEPGASTTTGAFTNAVLRMMAIMPEAIPRDTWAAQLQPRTPQNPSWTMPAAKSVWPPQRYLVTHEWGHATGYRYLDPAEAGNRARVRTMEEQGAVPINGRVPDVIAQGDAFTSAARWAMNSNVPGGQPGGDLGLFLHKYLSGYGLTSPQEGYAELFTQYFLDGARKGNPLVDALRDAEGWKR